MLYTAITVTTVAGILLHECGHWAAHRYFGNKSRISYDHTLIVEPNEIIHKLRSIEAQYPYATENDLDFPMRKEYDVLAKEARREGMIGVAGGPLVTMFIVMTAFIFLFRYRRKNGTSS